jgi:hypothetical protein
VRLVSDCGAIRVRDKQIFVSATLDREYVGLEEVDNGIYDVYFCFYKIACYIWHLNRLEGIISKVPARYSQL